jgi:hypothetical protein
VREDHSNQTEFSVFLTKGLVAQSPKKGGENTKQQARQNKVGKKRMKVLKSGGHGLFIFNFSKG